nr:Retinol dehydrogenase 12 [Polyrhizophydium stewartii]
MAAPKTNYRVREAVTADAPALVPIINAAYRGHGGWTTEADIVSGMRIDLEGVTATIESPNVILLVIEDADEDKLIGSIEIEHYDADTRTPLHDGRTADAVLLGLFAIEPAYQSRGAGSFLLDAALELARQLGKKRAFIWVIHTRAEIIAWYAKRGFTKTDGVVGFVMPDLLKVDNADFHEQFMFWSTPTFSTADIPDLAGKVVIVTGGSNGLGLASAVALAAKGAHVIVSCRNEDKGNAAVADIKAKAGMPAATVEFGIMEQSDLASVRRFADWFLAKGLRLDVLMLNAGVFGATSELIDGVETHMLVNHLSHMLLAQLLLPKLKESAPSRIVFVGSDAHHAVAETIDWRQAFAQTYEYTISNFMRQYGISKLANSQTANSLARQLGTDSGVLVNTAHPGGVATNAGSNSPLSQTFMGAIVKAIMPMVLSRPEDGALTQLYLATHPDIEKNKITGKYFVPTAVEKPPSALALDETSQQELWQLSDETIRRILGEKGVPL